MYFDLTAAALHANSTQTSDDFFALDRVPASVAVVGAGYIAVELAGILNALGAATTLFIRGDCPLRLAVLLVELLGVRLAFRVWLARPFVSGSGRFSPRSFSLSFYLAAPDKSCVRDIETLIR